MVTCPAAPRGVPVDDPDGLTWAHDRLAIQDLYARYAAALNRIEFDALDRVFTAGARIDASAFGVAAVGYDEFKPFLAAAFTGFRGHLYATCDLVVELDGDHAEVRAP